MDFSRIAETIALSVEGAGIGVIALGALVSTGTFVWRLVSGTPFKAAYGGYRQNLGRGILLGLEFLVAADIIHTVVVDLTFTSLATLGLIVVIRTFLSFTLQLEVEGRWPWQKAAPGRGGHPAS